MFTHLFTPEEGEQLESVHIQRQRAQAAHDLVDYYFQISRDDTSSLDVLRKQKGKEGRRQLALILRRLNVVAKEVDLPIAEKVRGHRLCDCWGERIFLFILHRLEKILISIARSSRKICSIYSIDATVKKIQR